MPNYEDFLPEISRVLRPGGMFLFSEIEFMHYESHDPNQTPLSSPNLLASTLVIQGALEKQSVSIYASTQMADWLARLGGFSSVKKQWCGVPSGPWHPDPLLQDIGMMSVRLLKTVYLNLKPLLKSLGSSDEEIDKLVEMAMSELQNPLNQLILKYHVVCAFKA